MYVIVTGVGVTVSRAWNNSLGNSGDSRWRAVRIKVLTTNAEVNGGRCQLMIDGVCTHRATQVHHTRSRAIVGDNPDYLMAVCKECNLLVGEPEKHSPMPVPHTQW